MTRLRDWEVLELVGTGSTAVVHRAVRRDRPGQVVALKRVRGGDPAAVADLEREADLLADLSHPAIAVLHEVVVEPDEVVLVLALATGGTLAARLEREGALPWPEVADLGARLADALAVAHDAGVVHRDVKPSNVLFGREEEPRLADFGLARLQSEPDHRIAGTAGYLDPDVVAGAVPGPRSDTWSLGVLLWEALAGRHPFAGADSAAMARAADRGDHLPLADLVPDAPGELVRTIERAMARDPGARFATARDLHGALAALRPGLLHAPVVPAEVDEDTAPVGRPGADPAGAGRIVDLDPGPDIGATTTWGPRPPVAGPEPPGPVRRWPLRVAVGVLALAPLLVVGWALARTLGTDAPGRPDASAEPVRPILDDPVSTVALPAGWSVRSASSPCTPQATPGPGTAPGQDRSTSPAWADVDGRDCSVPVRTAGDAHGGRSAGLVLEVGGTGPVAGRWELDVVADRVLLGDWDGDGDETPAVVLPDGTVWVFTDWADTAAGRAGVHATGPIAVVTDPDGRDHVVPASGTGTPRSPTPTPVPPASPLGPDR